MAYNLASSLELLAIGQYAKACTGTIRSKIINVPAQIASSARRQQFRLHQDWPWQPEWQNLVNATHAQPQAA